MRTIWLVVVLVAACGGSMHGNGKYRQLSVLSPTEVPANAPIVLSFARSGETSAPERVICGACEARPRSTDSAAEFEVTFQEPGVHEITVVLRAVDTNVLYADDFSIRVVAPLAPRVVIDVEGVVVTGSVPAVEPRAELVACPSLELPNGQHFAVDPARFELSSSAPGVLEVGSFGNSFREGCRRLHATHPGRASLRVTLGPVSTEVAFIVLDHASVKSVRLIEAVKLGEVWAAGAEVSSPVLVRSSRAFRLMGHTVDGVDVALDPRCLSAGGWGPPFRQTEASEVFMLGVNDHRLTWRDDERCPALGTIVDYEVRSR